MEATGSNPVQPTIFMNDSIKQLLALQDRDLELDKLQGEIFQLYTALDEVETMRDR